MHIAEVVLSLSLICGSEAIVHHKACNRQGQEVLLWLYPIDPLSKGLEASELGVWKWGPIGSTELLPVAYDIVPLLN